MQQAQQQKEGGSAHLLDHHLQRVLDALRADAAVAEALEGEVVRAARGRAVHLRQQEAPALELPDLSKQIPEQTAQRGSLF